MRIRVRERFDCGEAEVTPEALYLRRREFLRAAAGAGAAALLLPACGRSEPAAGEASPVSGDGLRTAEEPTSFEAATTYNNFYEFGPDKEDPARLAGAFVARPWSVRVDGEVARPGTLALEDLLAPHSVEERIYRLRCVEAWSMVIPWRGVPLGAVLARFAPTSRAKYVAFETVFRPEQMPGQRREVLAWPYREGLRIDEAMHPLAFLATGLYGRDLPGQSGAPLRLVVPWKYGFKSIKSIVRMSLVEARPATTWSQQAPDEYGFYANVNPEVDHPRWSQKSERRVGELRRRPTLPFNGYAAQVAGLYAGMDLRADF